MSCVLAFGGAKASAQVSPVTLSGAIELPGSPALRWTLDNAVESSSDPLAPRILAVMVSGDGLNGGLKLELKSGSTRGKWTLDLSMLDLGLWLAPLMERLGKSALLGDTLTKGQVHVRGEGTIEDGTPRGAALLELENAEVTSFAHDFNVHGLNLRANLQRVTSELATPDPQSLTFTEARFANVVARNGEILFTVLSNSRIRIDQATFTIFGGTISIEPIIIDLSTLSGSPLAATLIISNVRLGEIASLLPDVIAEAQGRLSGRMGARWSQKNGFKLGDGTLQIEKLESVEVRLTPQPGFLTEHAPERLTLFPSWTGPLARWFSPKNPAHETLRQIELGLMSLRVESLTAAISPDGDSAGRTAHVQVTARPSQASAVDLVNFEVNVSGPLDEVIKLGFGNNVSVKAGK